MNIDTSTFSLSTRFIISWVVISIVLAAINYLMGTPYDESDAVFAAVFGLAKALEGEFKN